MPTPDLNVCLPPPLQVEAYDADELNFHGGLRVSFAMQLMAATARIEAEIPSIKWPFLLLHGDADKLCDLRGSVMMYENTPSSDKKIKVGWGSSGRESRVRGGPLEQMTRHSSAVQTVRGEFS